MILPFVAVAALGWTPELKILQKFSELSFGLFLYVHWPSTISTRPNMIATNHGMVSNMIVEPAKALQNRTRALMRVAATPKCVVDGGRANREEREIQATSSPDADAQLFLRVIAHPRK